ncbi:MAG: hypothetical protein GY718_17060 [Lentisphaerae bacterium]|nr:hypothetical protein [Lentisphaerota bacterium]
MKKLTLALLVTGAATVAFAADQADAKKAPAPAPAAKAVAAQKVAPAAKVDAKAAKPEAKDIWGFLPQTIAEVDGKKVPKEELIKFFTSTLPGGKMPPRLTQDMLKQMASRLVKTFIERKVLMEEAAKAGFKPSQALAEKNFRDNLKKLTKQQLEMVKSQLARSGMTIDKFIADNSAKKQVQDNAAIDAFVNDRLISKISVTDKEVTDYYNNNKAKFKVAGDPKDAMRASHILIAFKDKTPKAEKVAEAKAKDIEARLKKGESFEKLAREYSACPSGKTADGSLGAFKAGQMVKPFEDAVKNLKPGQVSGLVKTKFGYHIIRRDALKQASMKTLKEEAPMIKQLLKQQKIAKQATPFIKSIEKKHNIKYFVK